MLYKSVCYISIFTAIEGGSWLQENGVEGSVCSEKGAPVRGTHTGSGSTYTMFPAVTSRKWGGWAFSLLLIFYHGV